MPQQRTTTPWSKDQRHALYLIFQQVKGQHRARIFNHLFKDYLAEHGRQAGHKLGTISSQYHEQKKPKARALWVGISFAPFTYEDQTRRQMWQQRINDACTYLSITLQEPPSASRKPGEIRSHRSPSKGSKHGQSRPTLLQDTTAMCPENVLDLSSYSLESSSALHHDLSASTNANALPDAPTMASEPPSVLGSEQLSADQQQSPASRESDVPRREGLWPEHSPRDDQTGSTQPLSSAILTAEDQPASAQQTTRETYVLKRSTGPDLVLSKADYEEAISPPRAIPGHEAHLTPLPAVMFRLWSTSSGGQNSHRGFEAGKFERNNIFAIPTPASEHLCWHSVFSHLNQERLPSPFISCSSSFSWVIRTGLMAAAAGLRGLFVSLIDTRFLEDDAVFYAAPFYEELKRKKALTHGNWINNGAYEFLVYRKISEAAMINTIAVDDLLSLCCDNTAIASVITPQVIDNEASTSIDSNDCQLIKLLAEVLNVVGMSALSPSEHISAIIEDVLQAQSITVYHASAPTWANIATKFVHWLSRSTDRPVSLIEGQSAKLGLLDGIAWACYGRQPRASHDRVKHKAANAARLGLSSPHAILMAECHAAIHALQTLAGASDPRTADDERSQGLSGQASVNRHQHVDEAALHRDSPAQQHAVAEDSSLLDYLMK